MDFETVLYLSVALIIVFIVILSASNLGVFSGIAFILGLLAIAAILMLAFADFLIYPLFTKVLNLTTIPAKNYVIPKTQDAVIKYVSGVYYATGYLTGNVYNYIFAQEQNEEDQTPMIVAPEKWESAIMSIHFPFKFNVIAAAEEIQKFRDELEGKRGLLEFQYSKESSSTNPNAMNLQNMQRQMNIIQAKIDQIGQGERPVNTLMYIESTAVGISEKEASDNLTTQLNELQTVFNVFDLSITRVIGLEIYLLFKLNYLVPGIRELESQFQVQK